MGLMMPPKASKALTDRILENLFHMTLSSTDPPSRNDQRVSMGIMHLATHDMDHT